MSSAASSARRRRDRAGGPPRRHAACYVAAAALALRGRRAGHHLSFGMASARPRPSAEAGVSRPAAHRPSACPESERRELRRVPRGRAASVGAVHPTASTYSIPDRFAGRLGQPGGPSGHVHPSSGWPRHGRDLLLPRCACAHRRVQPTPGRIGRQHRGRDRGLVDGEPGNHVDAGRTRDARRAARGAAGHRRVGHVHHSVPQRSGDIPRRGCRSFRSLPGPARATSPGSSAGMSGCASTCSTCQAAGTS